MSPYGTSRCQALVRNCDAPPRRRCSSRKVPVPGTGTSPSRMCGLVPQEGGLLEIVVEGITCRLTARPGARHWYETVTPRLEGAAPPGKYRCQAQVRARHACVA